MGFSLSPFLAHSFTHAHHSLLLGKFSCDLIKSDEYCAMNIAHFIHIYRPPQTLPYPYNRERKKNYVKGIIEDRIKTESAPSKIDKKNVQPKKKKKTPPTTPTN